MSTAVATTGKKNQIQVMAQRLNIDAEEMHNIVINTVMPNGGKGITNEQFVSFLAVANEYNLNPLTKEIYAFPAKGGGIQPIVSIDGWLGIINSHPQFDGMDIEFAEEKISMGGKQVPEWCKVKVYRKDRNRPVEVVEYIEECFRGTDPWKQKPRRMLQHKAVIQGARYAFGISGIIDEDEKESFKDMGVITPEPPVQEVIVNDQPTEEQEALFAGFIERFNTVQDIETLNKIGKEIGASSLPDKLKSELKAEFKTTRNSLSAQNLEDAF